MTRLSRIAKLIGSILLLAIVALCLWLFLSPPALLRIGSGYAAKIVCSNVFLAGRDPREVLALDVQAPGNPLLRLMHVSVDYPSKRVSAGLLGLFATSQASYREGFGCTVMPDSKDLPQLAPPAATVVPPEGHLPWPEGEEVETDQRVASVLSDEAMVGAGMRAVVVVKSGKLVAEAYGKGFSKDTPLLGWSMTKTVNAAIIGTLLRDKQLSLDDKDLLGEWRDDARRGIRLADLLAMESGLAFNENYGSVADVTRMLYLEEDMASFASSKPLVAQPGTRFDYSSGTPVVLARIWMNRLPDGQQALDYPNHALFRPLGMRSAVLEVDAAGTFVAGSYMYATARDWARFGLLLVQDGVWKGERLLPEGFVEEMRQPNGSSGGSYSRMQTWLPRKGERGIPADTFFMRGHDGQTIAVIPSLELVVVRLGLTPSRGGYNANDLVAAVVEAVGQEK